MGILALALLACRNAVAGAGAASRERSQGSEPDLSWDAIGTRTAREALWHWDPETDRLTSTAQMPDVAGLAIQADTMTMSLLRHHVLVEDRPVLDGALERLQRGGSSGEAIEVRIRERAGDIRHLQFNAAAWPRASGRPPAIAGSAVDRTRARRRDARLLLLERAVESTTDGILIVDALATDMPLIFVNAGFERITGYGRTAVLGRNCRFLQGSDRQQAGVATLADAIRSGEPASVLLRNYRQDGVRFWNSLSIAPVQADDGRTTHFVGVMADVTERIEAENLGQLLRQRLEQAQRMQHLAALVGGVGHDIKNALVPILSLSKLLEEDASLPDPARRLAGCIHRSGTTVRALAQSALDRARDTDMRRHRLELSTLVRDSIELIRPGLPAGITVTVDGDADSVVLGGPAEIHQVLLNLLTNAAQAIGPNQGRIDVQVRDDRPAGDVRLIVRDTGAGMSPDVLERARQPFYSGNKGAGLGIGLTLVGTVVEDHGGRLEIESRPCEGTTVAVHLPRAPAAANLDADDLPDGAGASAATTPQERR
ncbi:nitrogen regulation protein NR(II) [Marinibaculum pumilum]|uniref:histidine kinase n=1 Tax=Marinibaculum pumilum TaxID=1766165 RepID=A0ABV7KTT7_9PROT